MMIVRLFCPYCAYEATQLKQKAVTIDVPIPVVQLADDGRYEVICEKNHRSVVILNNIKFELLFEMGLNAIVDGYYREGVSSFASALERFYEFYWRVVAHKFSVSDPASIAAWKHLGKLSERQIGGYVTASLLLTGNAPTLLNTNKDVPFRNNVIHNGYVPSADEATTFGDAVKSIIEDGLKSLRDFAAKSLQDVYSSSLPKSDETVSESEDKICGRTNILTALDVLNPPNIEEGDVRAGKVADQFERILREREPHRMHIFSNEKEREKYVKRKKRNK